MKKRSAMAIAAGLVAAMLVGVAALSFGLSGTQTADAKSERLQPRVRTIHRTVKIEREAKAKDPKVVTVVTASSSSPSSSGSSESSGDDSYENEGSDDEFENETESESEDPSSGGSESTFEDSGGSDD